MSIASFLARYAKPKTPAGTLPAGLSRALGRRDDVVAWSAVAESKHLHAHEAGAYSIAPIVPGMRVASNGVAGVVEGIDGGRVVWVDAEGCTRFTLSHYLERA